MRHYLRAVRFPLQRLAAAARPNRQHRPPALRLPTFIPVAAKLSCLLAVVMAAGMLGLGLLVSANQGHLLEQEIARFAGTVAQQVADAAKEQLLADDAAGLRLAVNQLVDDPTIRGVALFSDEGRQVAAAGELPPPELLADTGLGAGAPRTRTLTWGRRDADGERERAAVLAPIAHRDLTAGYALVTFDRSVLARSRDQTLATVYTAFLLMLPLALTASAYLGARITRPVRRLLEASEAISAGNFDLKLDERRNDEIGVLMKALNAMGQGLLRKGRVEEMFSRYVSPQVARRVLEDLETRDAVTLGGRQVQASVIFADIVGFTSLSETMLPQQVNDLLNEYFGTIGQAVRHCRGHVDKYMGDCVMVVFGVPEERDGHALDALTCAWLIMRLVEDLNRRRAARGQPTVQFRIGVNSGLMLAGNMGSTERMEYTVVGDAVNLASRLCHAAAPGQVIFTEEMRAGVGRVESEQFGTIKLRGKRTPVATYRLIGVDESIRRAILAQTRSILDHLPARAA